MDWASGKVIRFLMTEVLKTGWIQGIQPFSPITVASSSPEPSLHRLGGACFRYQGGSWFVLLGLYSIALRRDTAQGGLPEPRI